MTRRWSAAAAVVALVASFGPVCTEAVNAQEVQPGAAGWTARHDFMRRAWGRMTPEDRAALFDAHLAALHVGLKLTPDQEKLWPPLENALRECAKVMLEHKRAVIADGPPADPVAGLRG